MSEHLPSIPCDYPAEGEVISGLMQPDTDSADKAWSEFYAAGGRPTWFLKHRALFILLESRYLAKAGVDFGSIAHSMPADVIRELVSTGDQRLAFGALSDLSRQLAHHTQLASRLTRVRTAAFRREVDRYATGLRSLSLDPTTTAESLAEAVSGAPALDFGGDSVQTGKDALREWFEAWQAKQRGEVSGTVTSGLGRLDSLRGGFESPSLVIVGAFPASGKTAMAAQVTTHFLAQARRAMVFSLEMTVPQLIDRMMINLANLDESTAITAPRDVSRDDLDRIKATAKALATENLLIDPTPAIRIEELVGKAMAHHRSKPLDLIVVDFIQRVRAPGEMEARYTHAICELQSLMKRTGAIVLVLSQLNKQGDSKYAASIEENADLLLRIIRERGAEEVEDVEIFKDRHQGHTGKRLGMTLLKDRQRFVEKSNQPEQDHQEPWAQDY